MWLEAGQVAAEAAKQGSITIAIPTAFISSIVTLLGREALAFFVGKRKRNGNGAKPGAGETCREHGEDIATLMQFKASCESSLTRIEGKVDRLLERK